MGTVPLTYYNDYTNISVQHLVELLHVITLSKAFE